MANRVHNIGLGILILIALYYLDDGRIGLASSITIYVIWEEVCMGWFFGDFLSKIFPTMFLAPTIYPMFPFVNFLRKLKSPPKVKAFALVMCLNIS